MRYLYLKHKNQNAEGEYFALDSEQDVLDYLMHEQELNREELLESIRIISDGGTPKLSENTNKLLKGLNKNPVTELDNFYHDKKDKFLTYVSKGYTILINPKGGYHFLDDKIHEIIHEEDLFEIPTQSKQNVFIIENTKRIVLENDPNMDRYTERYFKEKEEKFSYVTDLRSFTKEHLIDVFNQFKKQGGDTLFVYTTGSDIPQMYDYMNVAVQAGMKKYEFIFAAGITEGIQKFLDEFKDKNIEVIKYKEIKKNKKKKTLKM